jgi:Mitochondrial carrier protein
VTRLQTQRTKGGDDKELYSSFVDAVQKIYASEGIAGLYSGWSHDTIASVSSTFFYHFAYQWLRERRLRRVALRGEKTLGVVEELLVGALAGVFSRFFTTPMNNLVTRKQTAGQASKDGKVPSSMTIFKDIYREKGITGTFVLKMRLMLRILVRISIFDSAYFESIDFVLSFRVVQIFFPSRFSLLPKKHSWKRIIHPFLP